MEQYILNHIDAQLSVLKELERYTNLNVLRPRMLSGHLLGNILTMLCKMINPISILEIGTFTGYSTICMAQGMKSNGHIHTIEINDELENVILTFLDKANITNQVTLHIGNAIDIIPKIDLFFDLIYIDGDKREYPKYLELALQKVTNNGFILADNTLWDGKVAKLNMPDDAYTKGIMDFNEMVKLNTNLEKVIIPIRDGLTIIRKKS
ncbi:MAG: O-methyltransferase [Marinilabiliaceae bacterium]|nr:O-methyltransferase [Marinilabiliaceae bacterium]